MVLFFTVLFFPIFMIQSLFYLYSDKFSTVFCLYLLQPYSFSCHFILQFYLSASFCVFFYWSTWSAFFLFFQSLLCGPLYPIFFSSLYALQKFFQETIWIFVFSTLVWSSWREFSGFQIYLSTSEYPFHQRWYTAHAFWFHFQSFPVSLHPYDTFGILRIGSAFFLWLWFFI